eukprot:TRINITY_DN34554_c2_g2_i10.p3 TRINITY_DN34554_c2_g2~~TRINITY_DN34554_c2_g2_i10.p3  ORF type:complete len:198 (-),score=47.61 TRINITY_DN34554_c2_g2_i10:1828-2421(-)
MNMVRSMLSEKKIPKKFWPEAVNWTIHILKRSPTFSVKNKTPEEAWSGIKPSVDHFKVFGCIAHAHVPDCKRTKLDDKSIKRVLLGIGKESKAYRLYDPTSQKIIVSRDVVFEENESWNWDESQESDQIVDLEWGDSAEEQALNDERTSSEGLASPEGIDQHVNPDVSETGGSSTSFIPIDESSIHAERERRRDLLG